ncbi:MAG: NAD(+)/NADH kinase [Schaedlerella sp.]|nr:NAD(+)/NADH kinase [Schaedlerella sp.]
MDKFYLITNEIKDSDFRITNQIKDYIEKNGNVCICAQKDEEGYIIEGTVPEDVDCAIVIGGDGTLIRAARNLEGHQIPLIGLNMGTLGFLAEVELQDFQTALDTLFYGNPPIERRMMMRGSIDGKISGVALNDIIVARRGNLRVVHFNVYVNGALLNSYVADGVIISTPTGSTGYNLSAGGPVVEPTADLFVLTPICSHALNGSSIVLSSKDIIEVEVCDSRYGERERALVSFDGAENFEITSGERVVIRKAEEVTHLVKLSKQSFMHIMSNKMKGI